MGAFVPSIIINSCLLVGSTAVNVTLYKARVKDNPQLNETEKVIQIAIPILTAMLLVFAGVIFGSITTYYYTGVVSPAIDFLFDASVFSATFSLAHSLITVITIKPQVQHIETA